MSEFEETGSEEIEVGKDEPECTKRDTGGSEEEKDNEDSREEGGEQIQVVSADPVIVGEVDFGEKGQKSK